MNNPDRVFLIGDVHGHIASLRAICQNRIPEGSFILQLGDMGIGFKNVNLNTKDFGKWDLRFIRGNHDDPTACRAHPLYAGEFGYWPDMSLFFCGGAWSIDWQWRKAWNEAHWPSQVWWQDEQLSEEQLTLAHELYVKYKPRIVCTHEAPSSVVPRVLANGFRPEKLACFSTNTSRWLQRMLDDHQPEHWIFGHYHTDKEFSMPVSGVNTVFHCLNELSVLELPITPSPTPASAAVEEVA